MLPNFIIIGVMKGGTTSLYNYIASHPDAQPSSIKEPNFFCTDDFMKRLKWYESLWSHTHKYNFEASTSYTKRHLFPGVPQRMYSILPDVKLIYILRDPIERIISHYIHNYAHGRESRTFLEIIQDTNGKYIQTSKYYFQIKAFLEYYSEKQLLIVESEKLRSNPDSVLVDVYKFLGLSLEYAENAAILEKKFNISSAKKRPSSIERYFHNKIEKRLISGTIRKICAPFNKLIERPVLSPLEKEMLSAEIAPDINELRRFSGKKYADWSV